MFKTSKSDKADKTNNSVQITAATGVANNPTTPKQSRISDKILHYIILPIIATVAFSVTIAIIIITHQPAINEEYFVSDETKTSISFAPSNNNGTGLIQTHFVYTYDGDIVSSLKTYFEYPDEETARTALESIKNQPEFKGAVVEGKYIVVTADENQYKGLTASDIKQQTDALKAYQDSQNPQTESANESADGYTENIIDGSAFPDSE